MPVGGRAAGRDCRRGASIQTGHSGWVHVMLYGRARIRPEIIILVIVSALLVLVLTGHGLWLAREAAAWGLAAGLRVLPGWRPGC